MKITALLLSLCFFSPATAFLQMVTIDSSFGPDGTGYTSNLGGYFYYTEMAVKPDEGIMLLGYQQTATYDSMIIALSSLSPDGIPDEAFGDEGRVVLGPIPYDYGFTRDLLILPDGRLLAGVFVQGDVESALMIFRFYANGTIDSSFADNGILNVPATEKAFAALSFTIDEQENMYLFGSYQHQQAIYKLSPNGAPDLSFGNNGIAVIPPLHPGSTEWGRDIVQMPDGKFITTASVEDTVADGYVTSKWNADGTPDIDFGMNGSQIINEDFSYAVFCSIHPQPDGRILYKDY